MAAELTTKLRQKVLGTWSYEINVANLLKVWLPHTVGMCQMEPCSSAVFEKRSGNERTTVEVRPFLFLLQTTVIWLSLRAAVKSLDSHKHLQAGITPVNTQNKQQASPRCISLPFIRLKRKKHNYHICIIPLQNEFSQQFQRHCFISFSFPAGILLSSGKFKSTWQQIFWLKLIATRQQLQTFFALLG